MWYICIIPTITPYITYGETVQSIYHTCSAPPQSEHLQSWRLCNRLPLTVFRTIVHTLNQYGINTSDSSNRGQYMCSCAELIIRINSTREEPWPLLLPKQDFPSPSSKPWTNHLRTHLYQNFSSRTWEYYSTKQTTPTIHTSLNRRVWFQQQY